MSDRMLVATRKGLLTLARKAAAGRSRATDFPGIPVTAALHDARDGTLYAVLKHGHFGSKLHRSDDDGRTWKELAAPAFPADAAGCADAVPDLDHRSRRRRRSRAGCGPARFRPGCSAPTTAASSWQLVSALWNVPEREKWFGGGYDDAGIHTISPDPRDRDRVFVAISCGGVWDTRDDGESWTLHGDGLVAAYMPPELAGTARDAGPASRRALRRRARRDVDAASQRHLPLDRRRRDLDAAQTAGRRFRLRGRRASERSAHRLVRARDQGRDCACRATARWP